MTYLFLTQVGQIFALSGFWAGLSPRQPIILCIDKNGDVKKGKANDYVSKQYIGNLGKTARGIVSINAYAVVGGITYPLLFKIFKPRGRLLPGDTYKAKPQLPVKIRQ